MEWFFENSKEVRSARDDWNGVNRLENLTRTLDNIKTVRIELDNIENMSNALLKLLRSR